MTKIDSKKEDLEKAVYGLEEAIKKYGNNDENRVFFRDSAIQRFEMCFELAWKSLKDYLHAQKTIECYSPSECFRAAFQAGKLLPDDPDWILMTKDRNLMSHTYDEASSQAVFERLSTYLPLLKILLKVINEK